MSETTCTVFVNGSVIIFKSNGKIVLPANLIGFPYVINNEDGSKVVLEQPIGNGDTRETMREFLLEIIEQYREVGIPRIEFPRWNEMRMYPVIPDSADEEYWCPEQVIDSFLDSYGPEFII